MTVTLQDKSKAGIYTTDNEQIFTLTLDCTFDLISSQELALVYPVHFLWSLKLQKFSQLKV